MQKLISSQKQKSKTFRRTSEKMRAEGNPYKIQNAPSVESEGNEKVYMTSFLFFQSFRKFKCSSNSVVHVEILIHSKPAAKNHFVLF